MQVVVKREKPEVAAADMLAVFLYQEKSLPAKSAVAQLDARLDGRIRDYLSSGDFSGALNSTALLRTHGVIQAPRLLLVGLGKADTFHIDMLRQASATAATTARRLGVASLALLPSAWNVEPLEGAQALTEGALLGLYTLKKYKTVTEGEPQDNLREVSLLGASATTQRALESGVRRGQVLAEAVNMARDLSNSPGNEVNPAYLAQKAQEIAAQTALRCQVLDVEGMRQHQMGCLLGVAQGSEQPPAFIILEHAPQGTQEAPIVLVGKGLTFDSGGISIKPAANMEDMKMDMAGGAAVLGTMQALAQLEYPRRVVGLVPSSENLPSGTAVKPGDILRAMSGKTVEVINTDAEGRLILADALAYAVQELQPACIVDLATLTGAVVVALGSQASGMMGTDPGMMERLRSAGDYSAERVWELPLFEEYSKSIQSDFADLRNVSTNREAGSIIGAAFLKEFVGDTPWVHLDIAGTAWTREQRPYIPKGATGVGIRLLCKALEDMASAPHPAPTSQASPKTATRAPSRKNARTA
ncbi:MAG: leucyl aminopeptidase [Candidatus Tectimicrobiota bacterium]